MNWKVLSFCFLLSVQFVSGQIVNIENKRIYEDTSGWSGAIDATFSFLRNKDFLYNLNAKSRVQYKTRKHYVFLLSDFFYSGGEKVYANYGMGHLRYAYRIKNSGWKWESYTQVQYNQLLNQKLRALAGTGIRWKITGKPKFRSFIGTSVFFEYEEIQPNNEFHRDFRSSSYFSWFMDFKHFSCSGTTYYQPLLHEIRDYRFSGQYAFNTQIVKNLRFKTELNVFYDSRPPEGVPSSTTSFLVGLGYDFGK
ncbi:MAG: DUF481 domain-containing protein [Bacteroidota bacterium]